MRILVGWDRADEAELVSLYLGVDGDEARVTTDPGELLDAAGKAGEGWDAILLSLSLPNADQSYPLFQQLRRIQPDCPIIGACSPEDTFRVAKFLTHGLRSYVLRDPAGDFVFLLRTTVEAAVEAVRAEREQQVAERLREEIESVRRLQESILPRDLKSPPGYEICARYEPSQIRVLGRQPVVMAGGDYYNVFTLSPTEIVLLVGDASGHGMKACMSIMTMHTLIRMIRDKQYNDTAAFVGEVNRRLCEQSIIQDDGGFITLLYGVLHTDRNEFQWTSAGHPVPLLYRTADGRIEPLASNEAGGLPLGIYDTAEYETRTDLLPPDSRLLLYTDGLVEAFHDEDNEQLAYGVDGIEQTLVRMGRGPLPQTMQALFDDSFDYTRGAGRHDDTSAVLVERKCEIDAELLTAVGPSVAAHR